MRADRASVAHAKLDEILEKGPIVAIGSDDHDRDHAFPDGSSVGYSVGIGWGVVACVPTCKCRVGKLAARMENR